MANIITNLNDPHPLLHAFRSSGYSVLCKSGAPTPAELVDCSLYLTDIFTSIKRPLNLLAIKRIVHSAGVPLVTWNRDAPWHVGMPAWKRAIVKRARLLDIYTAHSLQQAGSFSDTPVYMPNAAAVNEYHLHGSGLAVLRDATRYKHDVTFVGSLNPRYDRVRHRVRFLHQLKSRLDLLGISSCFQDTRGMSVENQVRLIQESRINLNFGAACDSATVSWGLAERCFGIPACGGFLLSDYRQHARDTFPPDLWVDFTDIGDCVEKIRYYLAHFEQVRELAEGLHREVMLRHTYVHRARAFVGLAMAWREGRSMPAVIDEQWGRAGEVATGVS